MMKAVLQIMVRSLLFVAAMSTDCFASAMGLGSAGIKLPFRSTLIISGAGTLFLALSAGFAEMLCTVIPESLWGTIYSATLIALGVFNLLKNYIGKFFSRSNNPAVLLFDGTSADKDKSKSISPAEAAALAVALSADSLVTGISAGLGNMNIPLLCALSFLAGIASVSLGWRLGRKVVTSLNLDLGWLCGVILIVLAFVG